MNRIFKFKKSETSPYFVWCWHGWLPEYKNYGNLKHKALFSHKQFHWLWFNFLWDLRDMRSSHAELYGIKIKENKYLDKEEAYMVSPITDEDVARDEAHKKIVSIKG